MRVKIHKESPETFQEQPEVYAWVGKLKISSCIFSSLGVGPRHTCHPLEKNTSLQLWDLSMSVANGTSLLPSLNHGPHSYSRASAWGWDFRSFLASSRETRDPVGPTCISPPGLRLTALSARLPMVDLQNPSSAHGLHPLVFYPR